MPFNSICIIRDKGMDKILTVYYDYCHQLLLKHSRIINYDILPRQNLLFERFPNYSYLEAIH